MSGNIWGNQSINQYSKTFLPPSANKISHEEIGKGGNEHLSADYSLGTVLGALISFNAYKCRAKCYFTDRKLKFQRS